MQSSYLAVEGWLKFRVTTGMGKVGGLHIFSKYSLNAYTTPLLI
jgi:hypothetical protein